VDGPQAEETGFNFCLVPYHLFLKTGSHYVTQAGLELVILLPLLPKCWGYKRSPLPGTHTTIPVIF
jgi:hypothetical protein